MVTKQNIRFGPSRPDLFYFPNCDMNPYEEDKICLVVEKFNMQKASTPSSKQ